MKTPNQPVAQLQPNTRLNGLYRCILALLFMLALVPGVAQAQATYTPPERLSYQGFLTDGNGVALATNAPKNFDVVFRIYDAQSGGGSMWSEQQTVTVDKGYFSVLLGEGSAPGNPSLSTLFAASDASERYVEFTVKGIGAGGADVIILPRLRLLTSPYAFLANSATRLTTSSGSNLVTSTGAGITVAGGVTANNPITAPSFIGSGANLTGLLASQIPNLDGSKITGVLGAAQIPNLDGSKITTGTIDDPRLSANIPRLNAANNFASSLIVNGGFTASGLYGSFSTPFFAPAGGIEQGLVYTAAGANGPQFRFTRGSDGKFFDIGQNGNGGFTIEDTDTPRLTIDAAGNLGIGTPTPAARLEVNGTAQVSGLATHNGGIYVNSGSGFNQSSAGPFNIDSVGVTGGRVAVTTAGNVGIGTATPTQAKLVVNGSSTASLGAGFAYGVTGSSQNGGFGAGNYTLSIYAANNIAAASFLAFSDQRIKNVIGRSDSSVDLKSLIELDITDYTYIDMATRGNRAHKKLIAQQVERVFPQAVNTSTDVVPDIYRKAPMKDGWVSLATDLKKGERVKLIGEKTEGIHEVLEVTKDKFRTDFRAEGNQVFVFGREVSDFRTVDYEAIAMLNVSATQELARKVTAQETEISALHAELTKLRNERKTLALSVSNLEARDQAREARLARLELALEKERSTAAIQGEAGAPARQLSSVSK